MGRKPPTIGPRPASIPEGRLHPNAVPLLGRRFGKLEVVAEYGRNAKRSVTWLCLCDCGSSVVRVSNSLLCGKTISCGCNVRSPEAQNKRSIAQRKEGSSLRKAFRVCVSGAEVRGLEFELSFEEFESLTSLPCAYCGSSPGQIKRSTFGFHVANGIDRVDNNLGYSAGNCVPCCTSCNFMKRSMSRAAFVEQCRRIVNHSL